MTDRQPGRAPWQATMLVLAVVWALPACASSLTAQLLFGDSSMVQPVTMDEFTPPADATDSGDGFSGTLTLRARKDHAHIDVLHDYFDREGRVGAALAALPEVSAGLVRRGADVLPLNRGGQSPDHPYWDLVLQPGRAWDDAAGGGLTRISLPFALRERAANCTHNGVLTWLFDDNGRVSRAAYQVSSETCPYFKANLWGTLDAVWKPADLDQPGSARLQRLDAQLAARLPVRPLADLATDYPGVAPRTLAVDDGIDPDDITVLGMVVDGVHYRSDCPTRHGPYPFCDALAVPSYSTAKSLFAAVALMRLEARYPGLAQRPVADLVPQCDQSRWKDVTLQHLLDMDTGNFESPQPLADENSEASLAFIFDEHHDSKIRFACRQYARAAPPGSQFVYHTSDTYLLGAALQALVRREKADADLYEDVMVRPLWQPLRLSALLDDTLRTHDDDAQPFTGWGLTLQADDLLRLALWLTRDHGSIDGRAVLDRDLLDAALQRRPEDPGLPAGPNLRYNNGFWAFDAGPSLGCGESVWVPFMSGVSGITVALFPNGVIYYYISDGYVFRWQSARVAANRIRNLCP